MPLRLILLAAIVALNGFFAAAEVSLVSVRRSRLRQLAEEGSVAARAALGLLANPPRLLSVTQVGVTLASLGLGWAGEDTVYKMLIAVVHPTLTARAEAILHGAAFTLAFMIISFVHVVIGEVVPKNLAIEKADRMALAGGARAARVFAHLRAVRVCDRADRGGVIPSDRIAARSSRRRAFGRRIEVHRRIVAAAKGTWPDLKKTRSRRFWSWMTFTPGRL